MQKIIDIFSFLNTQFIELKLHMQDNVLPGNMIELFSGYSQSCIAAIIIKFRMF